MITKCNLTNCSYNYKGECKSMVITIGGVNYKYRNAPCSKYTEDFEVKKMVIDNESNSEKPTVGNDSEHV